VSDCQYSNSARNLEVYNMKGKVFDWRPASGQIGGHALHRCAGFREKADSFELTEPAPLFLIP